MKALGQGPETPAKPGDNRRSTIDEAEGGDLNFAALDRAVVRVQAAKKFRYIKRGGLTVNKNDLVASVATSAKLSKADAARAVEATFGNIAKALKGGTEVRLVGFGTFLVSRRAASEGRNPRTGERIKIPASKQPKFKAGKALKDSVNK